MHFSNQYVNHSYQWYSGKANDLDHNWSDYFEHPLPNLSACCLIMYVNCNLTGIKYVQNAWLLQ